MRVHRLLEWAACALVFGATAAIAQGQGVRVDVDQGGVRVETSVGAMQRDADARIVRTKDFIGLKVFNPALESLGKIEDLVIDPATGKIRYAVLSFGGFLGIGDKYFAVPSQKLSFMSKGKTGVGTLKEDHFILDASKDVLKNAPGFDKNNWPNFADANWSATVDQHFGKRHAAAGERESARATVVRAKDLTGLNVYNVAHESLGKIEELAIDPVAGNIRYAALSFGGVMGIGDKLFAVPWQKLSFVAKGQTSAGTQKGDYCVLDLPKDVLKEAPGFAKDNWPNFSEGNWSSTIDQFYNMRREATGGRPSRR